MLNCYRGRQTLPTLKDIFFGTERQPLSDNRIFSADPVPATRIKTCGFLHFGNLAHFHFIHHDLTQKTSSQKTMTEQHQTEQATFRNIGRGTCGSVFEIPGTAYAIKKGANIAAISNDFSLTNIAYNAYCKSHPFLTQKFPAYQIPRTPVARDY